MSTYICTAHEFKTTHMAALQLHMDGRTDCLVHAEIQEPYCYQRHEIAPGIHTDVPHVHRPQNCACNGAEHELTCLGWYDPLEVAKQLDYERQLEIQADKADQ